MKNKQLPISEFLKRAPGSFLSRLRSKFTKKSGLVQNSKIHNELCEEILKPERLKNWKAQRSEWEKQVLGLVYASGSRGLHLLELESNLDIDMKSLKAFLNETVSEMFMWHAKCKNSFVYYGFSDFEDAFLDALVKKETEPEQLAPISNDRKAELHLVFLLSKIQLKKISIKKDNSISRISKKYITEIFSNNKNSESKIIDDEINLLFSFLISEKWISKDLENNCLMLRPEIFDFLWKNGFRLFSELIFWWEQERFHSQGNLLKLLKFFEKPIDAVCAARLFWPYDTHSRLQKGKSAITWASLPRPLKEAWILGIVKMQEKKHILTFSLSEFGETIFFAKQPKQNISEPIVSSSSNFEWLLSQNNGPLRMFQMSCFAAAKNEENPLRFVLSKESFLNGLRSNLPEDYVKDFLSWNKATSGVAAALSEWERIYSDSSLCTLRALRIKNAEKIADLCACKPFMDCIAESIPNWGFIIKPECEKKICDMLLSFSLEPSFPGAAGTENAEILPNLMETENFKLPCPVPDSKTAIFDF